MEQNVFTTEEDIYSEDIVAKLTMENFGIKYLFPWQRMVIANILEAYEAQSKLQVLSKEELVQFEKENDDSFIKGKQIVLLPTGAGKSLCFQVPSLILDGPTLVIYPLLALMNDQMRRMQDGNLKCVIFKGGQTLEERKENFKKIKDGAKIILANPEVLKNEDLVFELQKIGIKHIAIDEAHCVSEWGDSFRPSYLELGNVIQKINPPVITAFTATASDEVLERVCQILFNGKAHIVRSESDRQNIHYYVQKVCSKVKEVLCLSKTQSKPMIVFCGTRDKSEYMARELNLFLGKEIAKYYHAGLEKSEKNEIEEWFFNSDEGILCATCAYGMGVDKKNIRTVIHLEPPTTVEAYIQEAGRGGRDGNISKAIFLWSLNDSLLFNLYSKKSRQHYIKQFAETTECRRQVLLNALGGEDAVCSGCDLCEERENQKNIDVKNKKRFFNKKQIKQDYKIAYKLVSENKYSYTKQDLQQELSNKMNKTYLKEGGKRIWNQSDSLEVISQLEQNKLIGTTSKIWKNRYKVLNKVIYP